MVRCQHEDIDDPGGKQSCKTKLADPGIVEETVDGIFTK